MAKQRILLKRTPKNYSLIISSAGQIVADQIRFPQGCLRFLGLRVSPVKISPPSHDSNFMDIYYYWGKGLVRDNGNIDSAFVEANCESKKLTSNILTESGYAAATEYFYFAHPVNGRVPVFHFNNTTGGFIDLGNVIINENGSNVTYRVWRSTNANLEQTEVLIKLVTA